jgi:hypothetical protein
MTWSLGEIEAETRKAVRGAGLSWGIAEEAGKALRWLAARGGDGLPPLAALLEAHDSGIVCGHVSVDATGRWHGDGRPLCPLSVGASLTDHARQMPVAAGPVFAPLLLVPFVARAAHSARQPMRLSWPSGAIVLHDNGEPAGALDVLPVGIVAQIRCEPEERATLSPAPPPLRRLRDGDAAAWACIARFAQRTYVPASQVSRERGAGAGLIDND